MNATIPQVLEALTALYSAPDPQAKKTASRWLDNFQKQVRCPIRFQGLKSNVKTTG